MEIVLEYLAFGMALVSSWVYGNKNIWGPILGVTTALVFVVFGLVTGIYAAAIANVVFLFVHIRNMRKFMAQDEATHDARITAALQDASERVHDGKILSTWINHVKNICWQASYNAGWETDLETGKDKPFDPSMKYVLLHSEVTEAMEAFRKNLTDDKLIHRSGVEVELADAIIRLLIIAYKRDINDWSNFASLTYRPAPTPFGNIQEPGILDQLCNIHSLVSSAWGHSITDDPELEALALKRALGEILALGRFHGLDIPGAVAEKLRYNVNRPDHRRENRIKAGGKAF